MAKNLVIVESPAKAKTIEKFLGKDFKVESSFGHIADLPSKELGVDVEGDFKPKYEVPKDKKATVKKLKNFVFFKITLGFSRVTFTRRCIINTLKLFFGIFYDRARL